MPEDINEILNRARGLQNNFYTAVKVSELLDDFNVSISKISKVIDTDPELTAKILRYCNSAQYGFARKVTNIKDAISIMGFKILKTIIFTIISRSSFSKPLQGYGLTECDLWKNSITCAVYARYIANLVNYDDPDQAYTAALLRDIGKIPLDELVKDNHRAIMELINRENLSFCDAEKRILKFNHSEISALLTEKWNFPQVLIDAIKYHHCPDKAEEDECEDIDLVRIVHLSDFLTVTVGQGIGIDGMMYYIEPDILDNLGLRPDKKNLDLIISKVADLNSEIYSLAG